MRIFLPLIFVLLNFLLSAQHDPANNLQQKAISLRVFLEKNHYQPVTWNDSNSAMLYSRWIELLDKDKTFFTRQDLDQLKPFQQQLDDELLGRGWLFFTRSIAVFKQAVQLYDSLQRLVLSKPVDFSAPDLLHYPHQEFAISTNELQKRIMQITKWKVLRYIVTGLNNRDSLRHFLGKMPPDFAAKEKKARAGISSQHAAFMRTAGKLPGAMENEYADRYLQAICWCYDPHTTYMNMAQKKDFNTALSGFEYSTGMDIEQNENGEYTVNQLEPGGSAWRSGELHKGDRVVAIKKGDQEVKDLNFMEEDEVMEILKGTNDEKVELTVKTAAGTEKKVLLEKEKITDDEAIVKSYLLRADRNYGYIELPGFYSRESDEIEDEDDVKYDGCANDVSKEIVKLKRDSIAGLILDLRFNGGGSMWEAMQLAGIFIDYGPVASSKDKTGKIHFLKDPNRGTIYDGPLLILINGASASASELVAAMLQDYNRALIAGSTTYGKGTAQAILPLDTAYDENSTKKYEGFQDFVKVTGNKFYRVSGSTTQWQGVVPDIAIPDIYESTIKKERSIPSALLPDQSKKGNFQAQPLLPVQALGTASKQRTASDSGFGKIARLNDWLQQFVNNRKIPLQWTSYVAAYQEAMEQFKLMEAKPSVESRELPVTNNNFDQEKIRFASAAGQMINENNISRIANDPYIKEACSILKDWIK